VAAFDRNGGPTSVGIGGRIASESVAGLHRITHPSARNRTVNEVIDRNNGAFDQRS